MLQNEREFARQTREKLQQQSGGNPNSMGSQSMGSGPQSMSSASMGTMQASAAGPASGKYGGFGSEDIARLGYNTENKFNAPYDPYTKGQSAPSQQTFQVANSTKKKDAAGTKSSKPDNTKKKKKKSKKDDSYDSESDDNEDDSDDSDEDSDSDDSEEKRKKAKRAKKKEKKGLAQPPSKTGTAATPRQQQAAPTA